MKIYGDYTQEELNRQYNQATLVPNLFDFIMENQEWSEAIREKIPRKLDIPYGPSLDERLDIFPVKTPEAPILIYHHGGA
ncbi:MAG: alpha/beta hydrolase, partial [Deltaproteobacteria bacterium]|nr:alpha/beta hydrolase [Deltaproteobacteria bacterium]